MRLVNIVIYDDDLEFAENLSAIIARFNEKQRNIFNIIYTENKEAVLEYTRNNTTLNTIFLLDIVINHALIGFRLAEIIKETNQGNIVIYITDYPAKIVYNAEQKLAALCFILKGSKRFISELEQSLLHAYQMLQEDTFYIVENNSAVYRISFSDIYYFEKIKSTHNICLVYKNGYITFKGSLLNIMSRMDDYFCYCHRGIIVNTKNIKVIDKKNQAVHFDNGQKCLYSIFYRKELLKWM